MFVRCYYWLLMMMYLYALLYDKTVLIINSAIKRVSFILVFKLNDDKQL